MAARRAGTSAQLNPASWANQQRKHRSKDPPGGRKTHTSSTAFPSHSFLRDKPPEKHSELRENTISKQFWLSGIFSSCHHCKWDLPRAGTCPGAQWSWLLPCRFRGCRSGWAPTLELQHPPWAYSWGQSSSHLCTSSQEIFYKAN